MFHLPYLLQLSLICSAEPPPTDQPEFPPFPLPPQPTTYSTVLNSHETTAYNNITITTTEAINLEQQTRQQNTDIWHNARSLRLTSSNFHRICSRRANHDTLAITLKTPVKRRTKAMQRGIDLESTAAIRYSEVTTNQVSPCGLVVNPHAPHLGTSPDRKVLEIKDGISNYGLLEIKCPSKDTIQECAFLKSQAHGTYTLNTSHTYHFQITGQMGLTGMPWCDFFVMCKNDYHLERIHFDQGKWDAMKHKLDLFFFNHFISHQG